MDIFHLRNFYDNFADGGLLLVNKDRKLRLPVYINERICHIFSQTRLLSNLKTVKRTYIGRNNTAIFGSTLADRVFFCILYVN